MCDDRADLGSPHRAQAPNSVPLHTAQEGRLSLGEMFCKLLPSSHPLRLNFAPCPCCSLFPPTVKPQKERQEFKDLPKQPSQLGTGRQVLAPMPDTDQGRQVARAVPDSVSGAAERVGDSLKSGAQTGAAKAQQLEQKAVDAAKQVQAMVKEQTGSDVSSDRRSSTVTKQYGEHPSASSDSSIRRDDTSALQQSSTPAKLVQKAEEKLGRVVDKVHSSFDRTAEKLHRPAARGLPSPTADLPSYGLQQEAEQISASGPSPTASSGSVDTWREALERLALDAQRHADFMQVSEDSYSVGATARSLVLNSVPCRTRCHLCLTVYHGSMVAIGARRQVCIQYEA